MKRILSVLAIAVLLLATALIFGTFWKNSYTRDKELEDITVYILGTVIAAGMVRMRTPDPPSLRLLFLLLGLGGVLFSFITAMVIGDGAIGTLATFVVSVVYVVAGLSYGLVAGAILFCIAWCVEWVCGPFKNPARLPQPAARPV